ncbi:MAG: hypothetical protein F4X25_05540 [Chloroflexi bacterium]|nr:hypothetical protein [Chloroflexota bacterium]
MASENTAGVQDLQFGQTLEGGRTYRLPDGSWLIDVPDGMTLRYSFTSESPTGTHHGFTDPETGSLIGIGEHTGEITRLVVGDNATAANARLDRFEASFRRAPGYAPPPRTSEQRTLELNADGIPILPSLEGNSHGYVFEGGRSYVIPAQTPRLLEVPAGISFTFWGTRNSGGGKSYLFESADKAWYFSADRETGRLHMSSFGNPDHPDLRRMAEAVTAAYAGPPASR